MHKAKSFTKDGKDISNKDFARLAMAGIDVQDPAVPGPRRPAVADQLRRRGEVLQRGQPDSADDWAPATEKFTRKVLAAPLT